ncbi:hypothetical protein V6N11_004670 [Hibiscus sabdariffa]|uniref:Uncharacterized protein n=1 Tax=Hibiscus sabdariffa TaxID=183260 RepID=A0ABR2SGW7_9ROSI
MDEIQFGGQRLSLTTLAIQSAAQLPLLIKEKQQEKKEVARFRISRSMDVVFQEEKDPTLSLDTRSILSVFIKTLQKPAAKAVEDPKRTAIDSATLAEEAIKEAFK